MAYADLNPLNPSLPTLDSGVFYGTLFLDCSEELAKNLHEKLNGLFGRVELSRSSDSAFTFAVSA